MIRAVRLIRRHARRQSRRLMLFLCFSPPPAVRIDLPGFRWSRVAEGRESSICSMSHATLTNRMGQLNCPPRSPHPPTAEMTHRLTVSRLVSLATSSGRGRKYEPAV